MLVPAVKFSDINKSDFVHRVFLSPGGEDEQQQLEDRLPGGVRRRRKQRVRPRMPPAGTGSVGTTGDFRKL